MPRLISGLSLKLSFDPHFVSLPSCVAPAGLVAGEWDVPLQSPQVGMQGVTPLGHAGLSCLSRGLALASCETCVMWWSSYARDVPGA